MVVKWRSEREGPPSATTNCCALLGWRELGNSKLPSLVPSASHFASSHDQCACGAAVRQEASDCCPHNSPTAPCGQHVPADDHPQGAGRDPALQNWRAQQHRRNSAADKRPACLPAAGGGQGQPRPPDAAALQCLCSGCQRAALRCAHAGRVSRAEGSKSPPSRPAARHWPACWRWFHLARRTRTHCTRTLLTCRYLESDSKQREATNEAWAFRAADNTWHRLPITANSPVPQVGGPTPPCSASQAVCTHGP